MKPIQTVAEDVERISREFLKDRIDIYKKHASIQLLVVLLTKAFIAEYIPFKTSNKLSATLPMNIAYKAGQDVFESVLENGCRVTGNGHHTAQAYCKLFDNYSFI